MLTITGQFKYLFLKFGIIYLTSFLILMGIIVFYTDKQNKNLAAQATEMVRRDILLGMNRDVTLDLNIILTKGNNFSKIEYFDEEDKSVFELNYEESNCLLCFNSDYAVPIFRDANSEFRQGKMVFTTKPLAMVRVGLALFLLSLVVLIPYVFFNLKELRSHELRVKNAIFLQSASHTAQILAHDLKKPFAKVNLILKTLLREFHDNDRIRSLLESNVKAVDGSVQSANDFLRHLIDNQKATRLDFEVVVLRPLIKEITDEFQSRGIGVKTYINADHALTLDRVNIKRSIINILENAVEASQGQGEYWVEVKTKRGLLPFMTPNWLEIVIGNTGSTLDKQKAEQIFEPGYSYGKNGGSGFGLSIIKEIVESHKGRIFASWDCAGHRKGYIIQPDKPWVAFHILLPS